MSRTVGGAGRRGRPPPDAIARTAVGSRRAPGHPHGRPGYITRRTPRRPGRGDTGLVRERTQVPMRTWLSQALAFARSAEPRVPLSRRAIVTDIVIAAAALTASLLVVRSSLSVSGHAAAYFLDPATGRVFAQHLSPFVAVGKRAFPAILLTTVPLAVRRRFPLSAFLVRPARCAGGPAIRDGRDLPGHRVRRVLGGRLQPVPWRGAAQHAPAGLLVAVGFWNAIPTNLVGEPRAGAAGGSRAPPRGRGDHGSVGRTVAAGRARGRVLAGADRGRRQRDAGAGPDPPDPGRARGRHPAGARARSGRTSPANCTTW